MNKRVLTFTLLLAFLFIGAFTSADASIVKWSQLPRMDQWGYDFSSETQVPSAVADDWQCNDARPVIAIRWWGSYWNTGNPYYPYDNSDHWGSPAVPPGTVSGFNIRIYSDVPAGAGSPPWSHPGSRLLYDETVSILQANEKVYGQIDHADGQIGIGTDIIETVLQYDLKLPTSFAQQPGVIYWLSIVAIDDGGSPIQWGWHQADSLWRDNAVQAGFYNPIYWNLLPDKDMAFEMQVVPLPNTLLLLVPGLISILGLRRRLR